VKGCLVAKPLFERERGEAFKRKVVVEVEGGVLSGDGATYYQGMVGSIGYWIDLGNAAGSPSLGRPWQRPAPLPQEDFRKHPTTGFKGGCFLLVSPLLLDLVQMQHGNESAKGGRSPTCQALLKKLVFGVGSSVARCYLSRNTMT